MSTKKLINDVINSNKLTKQLSVLESSIIAENENSVPTRVPIIASLFKSFKSVQTVDDVQEMFSEKKPIVKTSIIQSTKFVDDIFQKEKTTNPIRNEKKVETKQQGELFLKRFYDHFGSLFNFITYDNLRIVYRKCYALMIKVFIATGIVTTFAGVTASTNVLNPTKAGASIDFGAAGNVSQINNLSNYEKQAVGGGKFMLIPMITIMALCLTFVCILNAVYRSKEMGKDFEITLRESIRNVAEGFKKLLFSMEIDKETSKFAILIAVVGAFMIIVKKYSRIDLFIQSAFVRAFAITKSIFNAGTEMIKSSPIGNAINSFKKQPDTSATDGIKKAADKIPDTMFTTAVKLGKDDGVQAALKNNADVVAPLMNKVGSAVSNTQAGQAVGSSLGRGTFWADMAAGKFAKETSTFIRYFIIPVICILTIMYLLTEMVDHFNLKKIKEKESQNKPEDLI